jgi:sulfopyruvate decarboxylase TPP-binding subunit
VALPPAVTKEEIARMSESVTPATWQDALYDHLRALGVDLFVYVPDGGHKILIERSIADAAAISVPLTTEAEGVPMLAGHYLGGGRGVLLMQSSGVGNCVNQFSLIQLGRFPFLTLITMRGEFGEQNPWQIPMGQGVQPCMEALGLHCLRVEYPQEVIATATAAFAMAYKSNLGVGLLLTQKLLGAKPF